MPIASLTRASSLASPPDRCLPPLPTNGRRPPPNTTWVKVGITSDFPADGGAAIKCGDVQLAVYNFTSRGEWYACQNMCPHKNAFVLSRGIIGNTGKTPKVACPLHTEPFSLQTGESLSGEGFAVEVFPVKVEGNGAFLLLPPKSQLDALLSTELHCVRDCREKNATETECALI